MYAMDWICENSTRHASVSFRFVLCSTAPHCSVFCMCVRMLDFSHILYCFVDYEWRSVDVDSVIKMNPCISFDEFPMTIAKDFAHRWQKIARWQNIVWNLWWFVFIVPCDSHPFVQNWMVDALLASWWRIKLVKWHYRTFDGLCWFIMQRNCSQMTKPPNVCCVFIVL